MDYIETLVLNEPDIEVKHRIQMSMNNIRSSIFHVQKNGEDHQELDGAVHGWVQSVWRLCADIADSGDFGLFILQARDFGEQSMDCCGVDWISRHF